MHVLCRCGLQRCLHTNTAAIDMTITGGNELKRSTFTKLEGHTLSSSPALSLLAMRSSTSGAVSTFCVSLVNAMFQPCNGTQHSPDHVMLRDISPCIEFLCS